MVLTTKGMHHHSMVMRPHPMEMFPLCERVMHHSVVPMCNT